MSGYEHALIVDNHASEQRLAQAEELLKRCTGVVMLEGVALRPLPQALLCEVIDPTPHAHRCAEEFRVLIENAAHTLANSPLAPRLPARPRQWIVVDDQERGAVRLWPED